MGMMLGNMMEHDIISIHVDEHTMPVWIEIVVDGKTRRAAISSRSITYEEAARMGRDRDMFVGGKVLVKHVGNTLLAIYVSANPNYKKDTTRGISINDALDVFKGIR